jgi:hypothetical protein
MTHSGHHATAAEHGEVGHFFLAAAAGFRFALLRPSYLASRAGTERFLLFRLLMS